MISGINIFFKISNIISYIAHTINRENAHISNYNSLMSIRLNRHVNYIFKSE